MTLDALGAALQNICEPPCEKYHCAKRPECSKERFACSAFTYFVRTGRRLNPLLHVLEDQRKHIRLVMQNEIIATRGMYDAPID